MSDRAGSMGAHSWTVRFDSVATDECELMFAEGYLLEGTDAEIIVEASTCPMTAGAAGSAVTPAVAGRLGQDWVARLSGAGAVLANVSHRAAGLYDVVYQTPRLGAYSLAVGAASVGGLAVQPAVVVVLGGEAALSRVDAMIAFEWTADDTITATGKDYISAR